MSLYAPLSPKWACIKVQVGCAALLLPCIAYMGSWLPNVVYSELWVLLYISWAASCAQHFMWDAYEYQQLWYFSSVLCSMIKASDFSVCVGGQPDADKLTHLVSKVRSVDSGTVPISNNRRSKRVALFIHAIF